MIGFPGRLLDGEGKSLDGIACGRRDFRQHDVSDFLPLEEAFAVPVAGDA